MRSILCSKLGYFFKKCAGIFSKIRVPVLSCFVFCVVLFTVLLSSVFSSFSVFASESQVEPYYMSFYRFHNYRATEKWIHNGNSERYNEIYPSDMTVRDGYPYWDETTVICGHLSFDPDRDVFSSLSLSNEAPVGCNGFYLLPGYVGHTVSFCIVLDLEVSECSIASHLLSRSSCRFWLNNGWWVYPQLKRCMTGVDQAHHVSYYSWFDFTVTSDMADKTIIGFVIGNSFNMSFSNPSSVGLIGMQWTYTLPYLRFPDLDSISNTQTAIEGAFDSFGDSMSSGTSEFRDAASLARDASTSIFTRIWDHIDPNSMFGSNPSSFFPTQIVNALSSFRLLFESIVGDRLWIKLILRWSLAFGGLTFLLSIAHTVVNHFRSRS